MNCNVPRINCDLLDIVAVKFIGKDLDWLFGIGCFSVCRTEGKQPECAKEPDRQKLHFCVISDGSLSS